MEITIEQATEYLTGIYLSMKAQQDYSKSKGVSINIAEEMLLLCIDVVLSDVKINRFKE